MIYCINPNCPERQNRDDAEVCAYCSTKLLIENKPKSTARRRYRLHLLKPASKLHVMRYSELFEAQDLETGDIRILKVLKTPLLKMLEPPIYEKMIGLFYREFQVLKSLRHPGIPRVKAEDFFTVELSSSSHQLLCICMPKIEGITLNEWLARSEQLSNFQALDWLGQIVNILDYMHSKKPHAVFHRDIKPSNIMLQPDGNLVLLDFGGARPITESYLIKCGTGENETGQPQFDDVTTLVSTGYTPLEQFNGKALPSSDFYALGRTMIRLMTGRPLAELPIDQKSGMAQWRKYAPQIKKPLADLIDEMVAIAPGDRPKNSRLLLHSINKLRSKHSFIYTSVFRWTAVISVGLLVSSVAYFLGKTPYNQISARYFYYKASQDQSQNRLSSAKANYEKSLELDPNNPVTLNDLATACISLGDQRCAVEILLLLLKQILRIGLLDLISPISMKSRKNIH